MKDRSARPLSALDYFGGLIFTIIITALILGGRLIQIVAFPIWYPLWLLLKPKDPVADSSKLGGDPPRRSPCW